MSGSKMESNDVAKVTMNEIWGMVFSLINMASMAKQAGCKGLPQRVRFRVKVWLEGWQGEVRRAYD